MSDVIYFSPYYELLPVDTGLYVHLSFNSSMLLSFLLNRHVISVLGKLPVEVSWYVQKRQIDHIVKVKYSQLSI